MADEIAKWWRNAIMAKKRIGILTGGGDVADLNSVIKTPPFAAA